VNEDGAAIGINSFIATENWGFAGYSFSLHTDYIIDVFSTNGIPYTQYDPTATSTSQSGSQPDSQSNTQSDPQSGSQPNRPTGGSGVAAARGGANDSGSIIAVILGAVAVIIVLIVALLVALSKKPATVTPAGAGLSPRPAIPPQPNSPTRAVVPSMPNAPAVATLLCTSGYFNGRRFPVNTSLAIGRSTSQCQIVFPDDTQGISSFHCEIIPSPSGIRLTDKGSTYGTFLQNGRKLNAHESVTLAPGDGFYLADRKNEFKII
jgi:hypothetical protein